jgi:hypothetical protein
MAPEGSQEAFTYLAEMDERESAIDVWSLAAEAGVVRRCACGRVALGDAVAHTEDGCRPLAAHVVVERAAFPAPEVTSRDPWDGVTGLPSAVAKLAEKARAASWRVRVQRSKGCAPHATHGAAGAVKWRYAVRCALEGRGAYAVYDARGETWKSVMLWGRDCPVFPHASVTDLGVYLAAGGVMDADWYDAIRAHVVDGAVRKKEAAVSRPRSKREGMQ